MSEKADSSVNTAHSLNNVDKALLKHIYSEEFHTLRKPSVGLPRKLGGSNMNKNVIAKTSSGVSSMSSFEYIESQIHKETTGTSKRPNNGFSPNSTEKRIKTVDTLTVRKVNKTDINESGINILEDTLDSIDVTRLLEKDGEKKKQQILVNNKTEFDAFADYLSTNNSQMHCVNRHLFDGENTQIINQLVDSAEYCNETESKPNVTQLDKAEINNRTNKENVVNITEENKNQFKEPILQSFHNKLVAKKVADLDETFLDKEIGERSTLFEDEKITSQYRQQVDNLFEQIEHSIFAMGTEDANETLPDKLLDIIFREDLPKSKQAENFINTSVEWPEDTALNGVSFNTSFGTVIKKALINNATKTIQPQRASNSMLELSMVENKVEFHNLGPFYGLPYIRASYGSVLDWQNECLRLPAVQERKNLIYALPTSGGKTLVAEILMLKEIMCYKRNALFILPYVSIVQEKVWSFSPFGVALDFLVEEYASSKGVYPPRKRRRKNSVYVATIEKALGIINSLIETGRLSEIGLIVVDELHLIGEEGRGAKLEAALTKIMFLKANIQIVGMSATIGNLPDICKFLNADVYTQDFRPVELTEYVKCGKEIAKINWKYSKDDDLLKNCENVASLLCKLCKPELKNHKKAEKEQILHALKDEAGDLCNILKVSVQYGIAYHHSGKEFSKSHYIIIQQVILRSPYIGRDFLNISRYKQMVGRAGRAGLGEVGDSILIVQPQDLVKVKQLLMSPMNQALSGMHLMDGKGLRHLLLTCISLGIANTRIQLQQVASQSLLAVQMDRLEVDLKTLTDKVIRNLFKLGALKEECGIVKKSEETPLCDVSVKMNVSTNVESQNTSIAGDEKTASDSKKQRKTVILTNSTKLVVSELGFAAIKGGLELSRAHLLYEDLYQGQSCLVLQGHLHLLYLVTPYETAEQIKPNMQVYYDVFSHLQPNEMKVARAVGLNESVAVKMLSNAPIKNISERVLNRFYVTLMLYDLWNEMPVFQVSEKYQISRGIVQNLMMISATFASNVVNFCEQLEEFWAYAYLLKGMSQRLAHCCVKELQQLMELPAVKQSRAKQLYNAGYKTLQSVAKANPNDLVENIEFMSRRVANQLIAAAKMLLLERVENLREEAEDVLDGVESTKQNFNQSLLR
ncbi:hypothetical protein NQ317_002719 [Molorchus minor]|uniref:Helicase ATP-binding domain-containing protein n=1 Tax=Molorchus minor TaxID=1323400 RepID=A0ABQ9K4U0_9CUCU|nr:hypothetical protein NQ317_002719 [Molorchus minor]